MAKHQDPKSELYQLIEGNLDIDDIPEDRDGRMKGQGWWLENIVAAGFEVAGYEVKQNVKLYDEYAEKVNQHYKEINEKFNCIDDMDLIEDINWEVDLLVTTPYGGRYIVQCKDWNWEREIDIILNKTEDAYIPESDIHRLNSLASVTNAKPLLIRTCDVSARAARFMVFAEIVDLQLSDFLNFVERKHEMKQLNKEERKERGYMFLNKLKRINKKFPDSRFGFEIPDQSEKWPYNPRDPLY